jgi:hypothetical protein
MNQEKWDLIVSQIDELGGELQEIFEALHESNSGDMDSDQLESIENSLMSLRLAVDELSEQEIPED